MKNLYCLFISFGFLPLLSNCGSTASSTDSASESPLVQRLESIFYQDTFALIPDRVYDVSAYGAKGDGISLDTEPIQQAIDAAHKAGGGKVVFPNGTYLSGALFVKSNVNLHISEGVTIQAIQDDQHFPDRWTRVAGIEMEWPSALINVYEQKNVRITGKGIIDGNGKYWWDKFWGDPPRQGGMWVDYTERGIRWAVDYDCKRVRPVVVYKSENVLLEDFTVKRAGFWTISLTYSDKVYVNGLVIRNNIGGFGPSSDGINTDSSKDVLVENCDIDCNDDNLCIKSGRDSDGLRVNRPAENIVYRNCITRAGHGLFTIGSETSGGMRNIEVYGLEAIGTNIGIRFKSAKVRGGLIENVYFHDIKMEKVNHPFHFELNWYPEYSYPTIPEEIDRETMPAHWKVMTTVVTPPERGIPEFRNITLENIEVKEAGEAIYANAYPEKQIHTLEWKDISIEANKGGMINYGRDWKMENVSIDLKEDEPVELKNSNNIDLPEQLVRNVVSMSSSDAHVFSANAQNPLVAMVPDANRMITAGDTTHFSENIQVHILPEHNGRISFYEPLGDGFYISPVSVSIENNGQQINATAEREHVWTFLLKTSSKPQTVEGSNNWEYDTDSQILTVTKSGVSAHVEIR